jgi:D-cysteine desulfhydrase family pyridoxal phosphate-dependent enzyme
MPSITRVHFAHLPTPVEAMPRLEAALGGPHLLVKRDDLTGLALGGNKTRKLEFLVGDASARGARTLITTGAAQSNHCRQTAAAAARSGMDCILVLVGQAGEQAGANLLLDALFGAQIVWTDKAQRDQVLQATFDQAAERGARPYLIPYGGSNPLGALGYVFAMQEFMEQDAQADWVVFASSSGGTQAGLVLGAAMSSFPGRVLGISVDEPGAILQERVARLATETAGRMEQSFTFRPEEILVRDEYCAAGYGVLTRAEIEAIGLFARCEGLLLDPVYTGRAAAGMIDLIRKGFFKPEETVLFFHTGGQPALFAPQYQGQLE